LFAVAWIAILLLVGADSWPLIAGWLAGAAVIGSLWWQIPVLRLPLSIALLPLCVLLTWEGGLFFIPSAIALIRLAVRADASAVVKV